MSFHPRMEYTPARFHASARTLLEQGPDFAYTPENQAKFDANVKQYPADQRKSAILYALADVLAQTGCSRAQLKSLAERGWVELIPKRTRLAIPPKKADLSLDAIEIDEAEASLLNYLRQQKQPILLDALISATGTNQTTLNKLSKKGLIARFDEPERVTLTLSAGQLTEAIIELRGAQKQA